MLGHADLSLLVKAGVHWGLFGGAVTNLGTERHHAAYLPQIIDAELPGCFAMTETGHGSRRAVARHHGDVRPGDRRARRAHPGPARAQGLHRRRRPRRPDGRGLRPARHRTARATACTASWCRSATRTATPMPGVTIGDCGPKVGLNGVDNGRLTLRPGAGAAHQPAQPVRRHRRGRHLHLARSRTRPGGSSPCSAPWSAAGSAWPAAPAPPPARRSPSPSGTPGTAASSPRPASDDEVLPARLPHPPAQAAARAGDVATRSRSPRTSWSR